MVLRRATLTFSSILILIALGWISVGCLWSCCDTCRRGDSGDAQAEGQGNRSSRSCAFVRDDRERLLDILQAIDRISTKTSGSRKVFDSDEMLQVWVLHHLQIIGEAARGLKP